MGLIIGVSDVYRGQSKGFEVVSFSVIVGTNMVWNTTDNIVWNTADNIIWNTAITYFGV